MSTKEETRKVEKMRGGLSQSKGKCRELMAFTLHQGSVRTYARLSSVTPLSQAVVYERYGFLIFVVLLLSWQEQRNSKGWFWGPLAVRLWRWWTWSNWNFPGVHMEQADAWCPQSNLYPRKRVYTSHSLRPLSEKRLFRQWWVNGHHNDPTDWPEMLSDTHLSLSL